MADVFCTQGWNFVPKDGTGRFVAWKIRSRSGSPSAVFGSSALIIRRKFGGSLCKSHQYHGESPIIILAGKLFLHSLFTRILVGKVASVMVGFTGVVVGPARAFPNTRLLIAGALCMLSPAAK